jgi:hydrogenase maturation factor
MCFSIPLKIKYLKNGLAKMEDGRTVRLGNLKNISQGDYLEVYADMAVHKLSKKQALDIRRLIKQSK